MCTSVFRLVWSFWNSVSCCVGYEFVCFGCVFCAAVVCLVYVCVREVLWIVCVVFVACCVVLCEWKCLYVFVKCVGV